MFVLVAVLLGLVGIAFFALVPLFLALFLGEFILNRLPSFSVLRFALVIVKNLRRNLLRTCLTYVATYVLVMMITTIWSVLYYIELWTTEKSQDLKVIVSEKWQADSHLPFSYARPLSEGAAVRSGDLRPLDSMTWQVYLGTLDPNKATIENLVICIAVEPRKITTMLDEIFDDFSPKDNFRKSAKSPEQTAEWESMIQKLEGNKRGVIVGQDRLLMLNKRVGDRFSVSGMNHHKDLDLEFEIVGALPPKSKYGQFAFMNREYLLDAVDSYPRTHGGAKHQLANRSLDAMWLKVPDQESFSRIAQQIDASGLFQDPPVKCQTLSSALGSVKDVYAGVIWGMRWLLSPAILASMTLVLANAISISVRERRMEIAVLKVLGFRPAQVLALILAEGMLLGFLSGLLSSSIIYVVVNFLLGSLVELFATVPDAVLWWGPVLGALAAFAGSVVPAWSACRVNVGEAFARVA
jgi:putative ABC transport system permease protein